LVVSLKIGLANGWQCKAVPDRGEPVGRKLHPGPVFRPPRWDIDPCGSVLRSLRKLDKAALAHVQIDVRDDNPLGSTYVGL